MDSQGNLRRARLIKTCLLQSAFLSMVSHSFTFMFMINVMQITTTSETSLKITLCVSLLHVDASPIVYLSLLKCCSAKKKLQGLSSGIRGPTLLDFTELLDCCVAALSSALFYPIGLLVGSFSGAYLADRQSHLEYLLLAMNCSVMAFSYAAMPWSPSLWVLRTVDLVVCVGQGNLNVDVVSSRMYLF